MSAIVCDSLNVTGSLANFRNLIDGGDFGVNPMQRGTSQVSDISNSTTYGPDRWAFLGGASSAINWSTVADTTVTGFATALKFQRKNANADTAVIKMGQVLETADSWRCQGQQVTLSFYAKSGANYSGGALTALVVEGTGTNDTAAHMFAASWTAQATDITGLATLTTTMQRFVFTGTVSTAATQVGVVFQWTPSGTAGANDFVQLNGIQLEIGPSATPFEHRDVQVELEIAQRYFYQINEPGAGVQVCIGVPSGTNTQVYVLPLPVQMRAAPTCAVTVGSFKVVVDGAAAAAATGLTNDTTHHANAVSLKSTATLSAAAHSIILQGGGGVGLISASADF
jgi:hypothetical protein